MASYLILFRYTEQGVRDIKDSPARVDAARAAFEAVGGQVREFYLSMGRYDTVFVAEAPDDGAAARAVLSIASKGNVSSETLRLFTEDEFREIVGSLP